VQRPRAADRLDPIRAKRQHRSRFDTGLTMAGDPIPDDVRRFLLAKRLSVPHVEAILLMRREPHRQWDAARLALRLYVGQGVAAAVLSDLGEIGLAAPDATGEEGMRYRPADGAIAALMDRLDQVYAKYLVDVTRLIHSTRDRTAEEFAAAFRLRKD
jgi:hypothetical protein